MSGNIFNKQGFGIPVIIKDGEDYLSLTAMCKDCVYKPADAIRNFFSNKDVLRFVITRQITEDPGYMNQLGDFDAGVAQLGDSNIITNNDDPLSPRLNAISSCVDRIVGYIKDNRTKVTAEMLINEYNVNCIYIKKGGRNGQGVYAHHDIALHFATWLNPAYGVFVNKDYQRLKNNEMDELLKRGVTWKFSRRDAALWHRLLETTVRTVIVPKIIDLPEADMAMISEEQLQSMSDDVVAATMTHISNCINVAVFGMTAQQWKDEHPSLVGNARDYATEDELNLISYLEYRMIMIATEEPQHRWRKLVANIAKKCRDVGNYEMVAMFSNTGIITDNEPISYDARTLTLLECMQTRFLKELSNGEVHQCNDGYFRDNEGYIILAPKFK